MGKSIFSLALFLVLSLNMFSQGGNGKAANSPTEQVYRIVDTEPLYRDGQEALEKYLASAPAAKKAAYDKMTASFVKVEAVIGIEGYVTSVRVFSSSGVTAMDEAALAHIKNMPQWIPATKDRRKVSVRRVFEVRFQ